MNELMTSIKHIQRAMRNRRIKGFNLIWILLYFGIVGAYGLETEASNTAKTVTQTAVVIEHNINDTPRPTAVQIKSIDSTMSPNITVKIIFLWAGISLLLLFHSRSSQFHSR